MNLPQNQALKRAVLLRQLSMAALLIRPQPLKPPRLLLLLLLLLPLLLQQWLLTPAPILHLLWSVLLQVHLWNPLKIR